MPELGILGWTDAQVSAFIRTQFEAQTSHYRAVHPEASESVITVDDAPAGRLIVDRSQDEIRIVYIALLPEFRRAGVGSRLVRRLFEEADAGGLPVRCHVAKSDCARRFWEQLGLVARGLDGMHVAMERACATLPR